ncbi:LOW QUALITY PROTEIN: Pol Polyprotein [Phytophthora megakarya]|uniref:Pol Polyprotein n=1 Tax=Phytophthora megakarya TaxID=4795 RepID=A0A225UT20_9STRA|nr:LOW QUALITY PROTEIN: Pol Polyprotein [Phytophthora megakarya]
MAPVNKSPGGRKVFLDRGGERLEFFRRVKHYWLRTIGSNAAVEQLAMMAMNIDASPLMRWHECLVHLNLAAIKHMMESGTLFKKKYSCSYVALQEKVLVSYVYVGKAEAAYKKSAAEKRTKVNYERLMSDTCDMGKYLPGLDGVRYFQLIQDEGSRYKWCYPLKKKSDANGNTIRLMTELLAQGHRVWTFSSDGGGEFVNTELKLFLEARGIRFVPTHPYTPEENALVEKLNGVLVNKMRAAMHAANLPNRLWPEVLQYVVDIDNMSATRALNGMTPSEKLLGTKPNVGKIRVCGSVGFIHQPKEKRKTKLSSKAEPALLLGFARLSPGYRLLHLRTGQIVEARDVNFREDVTVSREYVNAILSGTQANYKHIPFTPLPVKYVAEGSTRDQAERVVREDLPSHADEVADSSVSLGGAASPSSSEESEAGNESEPEAGTGVGGAQPPRPARGRGRRPGRRLTRRQRQLDSGQQDDGTPVRRSTRNQTTNVRLSDYVLSLEDHFNGNPASVEEAMRSPQREEWKAAMRAEFESLLKNGTWILVDRPKYAGGKPVKVLTTKWVLCVKRDEHGNIVRYKARLVIHGFKQRYGFEY